jgi:hypothetical protein
LTGVPDEGRAVRRERNLTPRISEHPEKSPDAAIQQRLPAEELDMRLPGQTLLEPLEKYVEIEFSKGRQRLVRPGFAPLVAHVAPEIAALE